MKQSVIFVERNYWNEWRSLDTTIFKKTLERLGQGIINKLKIKNNETL